MTRNRVSKKYENRKDSPIPSGCIIAIGGAEDKGAGDLKEEQQRNIDFISEEILKRFVKEMKGQKPTLALIPTASRQPEEVAQEYKQLFQKLGVQNIDVVDIRNRQDALKPEFREMIERASGIMFTGGDQLRLTSIFGGTPILELMRERYTYEEIIIAGTSAGATAMSTPMIYEGETKGGYIKGDVRITTGLEFIKDVAIDTHFIARGRIIRMAQAIATNPGCIGIGLEEDTAIFVTKGKEVEVLGSGLVTVVNGMNITHTNISEIKTGEPFTIRDMRVDLLSKGERFILPVFDQLHI